MSDTLDSLEKHLPKSLARNILGVIVGLIIGGMVNGLIIKYGSSQVPVPEGVDPMDINSIRANADLYTSAHFVVPFMAHAVGTLVGAVFASLVGIYSQQKLAVIIGIFFLIGGIAMAVMIPEFWKFAIVDLLFAYIPMALLGWKLAGSPKGVKH